MRILPSGVRHTTRATKQKTKRRSTHISLKTLNHRLSLLSSRPLRHFQTQNRNSMTHRMNVGGEVLSLRNSVHLPLKRGSFSLSPSPSSSLRFQSLVRHRFHRLSLGAPPKALGIGLRKSSKRPLVVFASSHEDSKHSEIEVGKGNEDVNPEAEESEELWKQTLETFKKQALEMQSVSQEAYETYSKKAVVILKETSEQLKIHADKAKDDLIVIAKEISVEGKEYLATAAENSPEPVKEVVETFTSSNNDFKEVSEIRDFYFGIPYGLLLSLGGFLSFMVTGSISAIRFGVILGGALLAFSVASLKSYKRGEPSSLFLKGQAALALIIFLRETRVVLQRASLSTFITTLVSGAMVAFYLYRILKDGKHSSGSNSGRGAEN